MNAWRITVIVVSFIISGIAQGQVQPASPVKDYSVIWQDEFNGHRLDTDKWRFRGQGQKRGNAFMDARTVKLNGKGQLIISAILQNDSLFTGMVATEQTFQIRYGYFECRAALNKTKGVFPAFWLQSSANGDHGSPEKNGVELDIFEYFQHARKDAVAHTLHYGGYGVTHKVAGPVWGPLKNSEDGFHTFGLEWTPEGYTTFVDGVKTYSGNTMISKVSEFLVLSVGISEEAAGPLNIQELPDEFVVDYVRVYKKKRSEQH